MTDRLLYAAFRLLLTGYNMVWMGTIHEERERRRILEISFLLVES